MPLLYIKQPTENEVNNFILNNFILNRTLYSINPIFGFFYTIGVFSYVCYPSEGTKILSMLSILGSGMQSIISTALTADEVYAIKTTDDKYCLIKKDTISGRDLIINIIRLALLGALLDSNILRDDSESSKSLLKDFFSIFGLTSLSNFIPYQSKFYSLEHFRNCTFENYIEEADPYFLLKAAIKGRIYKCYVYNKYTDNFDDITEYKCFFVNDDQMTNYDQMIIDGA